MNIPAVELTDEELALLVQHGDKEQFGILMERYERKLFRYGNKFLSNQDNIEDVVQEVFIKTYQNIQSFDTKQKFSSWIYRIAHNTYVNALKKQSRSPLYMFDFDTLISHTVVDDPIVKEREQKEMRKIVDAGLEKLSPNYREILVLYYLEEFSYQEISDILRIPIGTVGIRLSRAKAALRKSYADLKIDLH
ncbi:MAG: RNA polymerase sigma factor [Patescibacteria group bacterium]